MSKVTFHQKEALLLNRNGPVIATASDISDLIGEAMGADAAYVIVPRERLGGPFFDLRSGFAGELTQKLVNYRICLIVVGDIENEVAASNAFRDYVREANRGRHLQFVRTVDELQDLTV